MPDAGSGASDAAVCEAEFVAFLRRVFVGEFGRIVHARIAHGEDEGLLPAGLMVAFPEQGELHHSGAGIGLEVARIEAAAEDCRIGADDEQKDQTKSGKNLHRPSIVLR